MTIFVAVLLGVVQGLTEFLPVSSSGHLVLFQKIFGIEVDCLMFDIVVHLGTLVAVLVAYRKSVLEIIKRPFCEKAQKLVFATLPTIIIALIFKDFFKSAFDGSLLFIGFFVTGIFMLIADYFCKKNYQYKNLTYGGSIVMGIFQGFAILPGISRSGSTITSAMVQGVRREESAEFSFLMSVPAIFGSLVFELFDIGKASVDISVWAMVLGFVFSAVFGYLAIRLMKRVIKRAKFLWFAVYLFFLSGILVLNQFVFGWF